MRAVTVKLEEVSVRAATRIISSAAPSAESSHNLREKHQAASAVPSLPQPSLFSQVEVTETEVLRAAVIPHRVSWRPSRREVGIIAKWGTVCPAQSVRILFGGLPERGGAYLITFKRKRIMLRYLIITVRRSDGF